MNKNTIWNQFTTGVSCNANSIGLCVNERKYVYFNEDYVATHFSVACIEHSFQLRSAMFVAIGYCICIYNMRQSVLRPCRA